MIKRLVVSLALVLLTVLTTSCSLAPLAHRVDAASVGKGVFKIENNVFPSSFSVIYGAGEKFDVGLDLEQLLMGTAWGRYSLINNPNGFSLAANGGVFVSDGEVKSNGFFSGVIASNQWNPKFRTTASVRYAELDYQFSPEDNGGWFSFDDGLGFDNAEDGSANVHADLTLSFLVKPYIELALGAACQYLPRNEDPTIESDICFPTIGFSYYRM